MRIQDRTSLGTSATQSERAAQAQKTGQGDAGKASVSSSADGDRVELSLTLGRLSQALNAYSNQRAERVQALLGEYQAGHFQPDSQTTSRAMVAEALSSQG